ncbi:MAG: outer membrane beta-barrel protein [Bacteroidales bacterium]|nr:outer membrane beta-barrel protein [Bacteroidales bacterium]
MNFRFTLFFGLFGLMVLFSMTISGQSVTVNIKDDERKALVGATLQMIHLADSATSYKVTDQRGRAVFENLQDGLYTLKISYIGFESLEKNITVRGDERQYDFRMEQATVGLDEFTVTARRPMVTQEDDKMIIDPEPIASISSNTLEVLESTPGLYVDQDGGIFLSSATPAAVYINGREQKMSSQDITNLLRNLPPGSVQRIEVLRTPSSRYDAASSGGIINIILKKGVKLGRFGSVNAGMNQGLYGNRTAGFSFNNSGEKSTSYINMNYANNNGLEELNMTRTLWTDTTLSQMAKNKQKSHRVFMGYGYNYDLNENLGFNYDGRINTSLADNSSLSNSFIETSENIRLMESRNILDNILRFLSIQQDLGLLYKLDTSGSELDTKLSYSYTGNTSDQNYLNNYSIPFNVDILGEGQNIQNRHFLIFQSDLTKQLPFEFKLETGFKSASQMYDSDADYFKFQNNILINDSQRTNTFNYEESINAAYFQLSRTLFWKILLKAGIRMEHTYMMGNQTVPVDTNFLVKRFDWFPYVYLSRPLFNIGEFELRTYLIYRKTISRPDYQNLNPYIKYIDEFMYETGNPSLKPQFTENYEANISFDERPLFAIGRTHTRDIFSSVVYEDENQGEVLVRTYDNLGKSTETYFRAMAGIPPGKKYFFILGGQYNYIEYDGYYDEKPLIYERGGWRLFTFHSLNLFKETKLTMSGFMMINGNYNFFELDDFGALNFGISQTFLDKNLLINISARDVLRTMVTKFQLNQGTIQSYGDRYTDNQRIGINIRYNFGIKKKDEMKDMFQINGQESPAL